MTGFDRAQSAYDNATPEYLDDGERGEWRLCPVCNEPTCPVSYLDPDWCDECGDQAVCPECKGT